jgi:hypothetical protein
MAHPRLFASRSSVEPSGRAMKPSRHGSALLSPPSLIGRERLENVVLLTGDRGFESCSLQRDSGEIHARAVGSGGPPSSNGPAETLVVHTFLPDEDHEVQQLYEAIMRQTNPALRR